MSRLPSLTELFDAVSPLFRGATSSQLAVQQVEAEHRQVKRHSEWLHKCAISINEQWDKWQGEYDDLDWYDRDTTICKMCGEGAANIKVEYHDAKILWPVTSDLMSPFTIENTTSVRVETPYLHCRCKSCGHQFDTQPLYDGF